MSSKQARLRAVYARLSGRPSTGSKQARLREAESNRIILQLAKALFKTSKTKSYASPRVSASNYASHLLKTSKTKRD